MRENEETLSGELNRRAVYLLFLRKCYLPVVTAIVGALIFGGIYLLTTQVIAPVKEYQAVSKLYLDFAKDDTGTVYDYYNGATWTDLLTANPDLYDPIAQALPDVTKEELKESVKAEILSDIRLLTVTVTNPDPAFCERVGKAVNLGLTSFGETAKEFTEIRLLSEEAATKVISPYRTRNAFVLGGVLGFFIGLFGLLAALFVDDRAYIPEDLERRFGIPVVGVLPRETYHEPLSSIKYENTEANNETKDHNKRKKLSKKERRALRTTNWLRDVMKENIGSMYADEELAVLYPLEAFTDTPEELAFRPAMPSSYICSLWSSVLPDTNVISVQGLVGEAVPEGGAVILLVPFGKPCGPILDAVRSCLSKGQVKLSGIIMTDADMTFLSSYYRMGGDL